MRASPLLLSSLIVIFVLIGAFYVVYADSKIQSPVHEARISKGLSAKINTVAPNENVRVIITLKKPKSKIGAKAARNSVKEDIKGKGGIIKSEYTVIEGMALVVPASKISALSKNPNIDTIEYDSPVRALLSESVPLINASAVWNKFQAGSNITGKGQTICIIDSGVDYNHPDLGGGLGASYKVLGGYDYVNSDSDPMDDHGHGTHVAGIAAANGTLKGVAPDANIIAIKVLNVNGIGSTSGIISGIDWCIANKDAYDISVISMSIGGSSYSSYCDSEENAVRLSIDAAIAINISVVASAGNEGNYTAMSAPACIQNVTRVGNTYDADVGNVDWVSICTDETTSIDQITCNTNRGPNFPDMLLAPGALINSTYLSNGFSEKGGTSMSAPHVSGLMALLNQEYKSIHGPNPTPSYLFDVINSTGVQVYDTKTSKYYSRIDALAAYNAIYPYPEVYSNDLDDDGDDSDNNFTSSYNASSNTPVWNGSTNKINISNASTGEGKLIIMNDTGLLFDGNTDYDLKDVNAGADYTLYNGLYVVDANAGIVKLAYEPVFNATFSNGDGNVNAGEVVIIKGDEYVITDNETQDQNITLGPSAFAKTLTDIIPNHDNATIVSGTLKVLYGNDGWLHFYNGTTEVDNVSLSGITSYPYRLNSTNVTSDEFKIYSIYVISNTSTQVEVTMVENSQLFNISNDEVGVLGYSSVKINDSDFPKVNEIIFLSDNVSLVEGQYVNVPDTYYSIYFDSGKNLDIFRRNSTPPNITSGPTASVSTSSATITWTTDEFGNSTVDYGTDTSYGSQAGSDSMAQSHSVTLSALSSSTTYHYMVSSSDFTGNSITSQDYNFTTSAPAPVTSTGNGGPPVPKDVSKTATVVDGKASVTITKVSAEKTGTITIPDAAEVPFKEIAIKVKNTVVNMKIDVYELESKPVDIAEDIATGTVQSYIQLDEANIKAADIDTVKIKFKVPVSWINGKNIDKSKVVLNRYANGKWNALTTTKSSEDDTYVYYSASSPGLSVFAISGHVVAAKPAAFIPMATTPPKTTLPPITAPPTTLPEKEKKGGICGPGVVLLFAMLPPIVQRRRKKLHKI